MKLLTIITTVLMTAVATNAADSNAFTSLFEARASKAKVSAEDLECLALNIYHESRSDNIAGQYAVADVVLNRVHDDRWPSTICDVVHEGPVSKWHKERGKEVPIKHRCQFSWYCDGLSDETKNNDAWRKSQEIAYRITQLGEFRGLTEGATHYHAHYVNPKWKGMDLIGTIGLHKFYRAR